MEPGARLDGGADPAIAGEYEGAYAVVSLREYHAVMSLGLFLMAISTRQWLGLLPWRLQGWTMMPPLAVLLVPVCSGLGALLALPMRRQSALARFALLANLTVFALTSLLIAAMWWYRATR